MKHSLRSALLGMPHAVLAQGGHSQTGFKRCALVALWQPRAATPGPANRICFERAAYPC